MRKIRALRLVAAVALVSATALAQAPSARRFEWTTKSAEAKKLLGELQMRIDNFQLGAENVEGAQPLKVERPASPKGSSRSRTACR